MTKKRQEIEQKVTTADSAVDTATETPDNKAFSDDTTSCDRQAADNTAKKNRRSFITLRDLVLFAVLFIGIQLWQQRDLLDSDGSIAAPHFTLPSLTGKPVTYQANNNKTTVFYFFAPWCSVCHVAIENLETLQQQITNNEVEVFIIALDYNGVDEVEEFVAEHNLIADVLLGGPEQQKDFHITAFPTYYVADTQGNIRSADMGYTASLGIKARVALVKD